MSVVLRGIDKPSDCDYCPFQTNGYCHMLMAYIIVEQGTDPRCLMSEISGYTLKNGLKVVVAIDNEGRERHEIQLEKKADRKTEPTISKMEQVDKDINVRSKEPQTERSE